MVSLGSCPLLLHQCPVARFIDCQSTLCCDLYRQIKRETVSVAQAERILTGELLVCLVKAFIEQFQTSVDGLPPPPE